MIELERFDRRRLFECKGHASTWDFLRRDLRLFEGSIYRRVFSARLIGRFPQAIDRLRDGRLCMTRLAMLKDVLNEANAERLFDLVAGLSKDEIKKLVADLLAKPVTEKKRTATIRKAPQRKPVELSKEVRDLRQLGAEDSAESEEPAPNEPEPAPNEPTEQASLFVVPSPEKRTQVKPLSDERYDISIRVSSRFVELLKQATEAESHSVPDGNTEAILQRGLELLIERAGKKTGKVPVQARKKPASQAPPDPDSAYIPADLRRAALKRDGHACTWPLASSGRCGSRHCLEVDHIDPHGKGGKTELSNLRTLCHAHNQQAAREAFGKEHIDACIRRRKPDD